LIEHSAKRAEKVLESIDQALEQIGKTPFSFPMCFDVLEPNENIRQKIVHSTFRIIYRIKPECIEIIEIFHGSRNDEWLKDIQ
jgi:plasmid stabilization system protein ParE